MESTCISAERIDQKRKELLEFWDTHSVHYRSLLDTYFELLEQRGKLHKRYHRIRLGKLPKSTLEGITKIEYLEIVDRGEVIEYIRAQPDIRILALVHDSELLLEGYSYRTISSWIAETRYLLKNHKARKNEFGVDPNFRHALGFGRC